MISGQSFKRKNLRIGLKKGVAPHFKKVSPPKQHSHKI